MRSTKQIVSAGSLFQDSAGNFLRNGWQRQTSPIAESSPVRFFFVKSQEMKQLFRVLDDDGQGELSVEERSPRALGHGEVE